MDDVIYARADGYGGYAIKSDYSLWEWGLGSPDLIKIMDDVVCIRYGLVLKRNGDLFTWGRHMGEGSTLILNQGPFMRNVRMITSRAAVKNDGGLWVWGDNLYGRLGDGTNKYIESPEKIMDDVAYVETGNVYTLIVKNDGTLWQSGSMEGFKKEYAKPYKIGEDIWLPPSIDGEGNTISPSQSPLASTPSSTANESNITAHSQSPSTPAPSVKPTPNMPHTSPISPFPDFPPYHLRILYQGLLENYNDGNFLVGDGICPLKRININT